MLYFIYKKLLNVFIFMLYILVIKLGRRQVVRQRFLISSFVGSNPAAPAKLIQAIIYTQTY